MSSKKQTAVDQLRERLFYEFGFSYSDNIHQELKAIEKEQIEWAYLQAYSDCSLGRFSDSEKYYSKYE
jgi:hypothetical protein